tara:strand:+ start:1530 stop:2141 length:612 start_codon:yes stop_codon:yes gene_type:complete
MGHTQLGKEVKILIPESARELTVEQYQKFLKVEGDETFTMLKALELFANIPLKVAYAMKADDILSISTDIFTMISVKHPLVKRLSFRGKEYGFVPNFEEMSFGEYIDLDNYLSDMQSLHKTIGVLYRPITIDKGGLYEIEPYNGTDGYSDFPLDVALGATLFFYRLSNRLLKDSQTSLEEETTNNLTSQPPLTSQGLGDGMVV